MNVQVRKKYTFYANICAVDVLLPTSFDVTINFLVNSEDPEEYSVAFEKASHFIHNVCYGSIFFYDQDKEDIPDNLGELANYTLGIPEPPCAQTIGIMIFCKLNAIMEDAVDVTHVIVSSALENKIDRCIVEFCHYDDELLGGFEEHGWWNEAEFRTRDGSGFESWEDIRGKLSWDLDEETDLETHTSKKEKTEGDVVFVNFSSKKEEDDEEPQ